jgi:hypothetical protein
MSPVFSPDQETDPIEQLLYSCFHARRSLDRIDKAIWAQFPMPRDPTPSERNQIRNKRATPEELKLLDFLYATPYGKSLADTQHQLRNQLANIAKQYVSLGIEERRTRMSEAWAAVILPLFEAISSDPALGLNRRQQEILPAIVEHHLRVIEGGQSSQHEEEAIREVAPFTGRETPSGTGLSEPQRKKLAS